MINDKYFPVAALYHQIANIPALISCLYRICAQWVGDEDEQRQFVALLFQSGSNGNGHWEKSKGPHIEYQHRLVTALLKEIEQKYGVFCDELMVALLCIKAKLQHQSDIMARTVEAEASTSAYISLYPRAVASYLEGEGDHGYGYTITSVTARSTHAHARTHLVAADLSEANTPLVPSAAHTSPSTEAEAQAEAEAAMPSPPTMPLMMPLVLRTYPRHNDVGLRVWEASLFLAEFLYRFGYLFRGKALVELGAGCGLTGLVLPDAIVHHSSRSGTSRSGTSNDSTTMNGDIMNGNARDRVSEGEGEIESGSGSGGSAVALEAVAAAEEVPTRLVLTDYTSEVLANCRHNININTCANIANSANGAISASRSSNMDGGCGRGGGRGGGCGCASSVSVSVEVRKLDWTETTETETIGPELEGAPTSSTSSISSASGAGMVGSGVGVGFGAGVGVGGVTGGDCFDVVLGADIVYDTRMIPHLCRTVKRLLVEKYKIKQKHKHKETSRAGRDQIQPRPEPLQPLPTPEPTTATAVAPAPGPAPMAATYSSNSLGIDAIPSTPTTTTSSSLPPPPPSPQPLSTPLPLSLPLPPPHKSLDDIICDILQDIGDSSGSGSGSGSGSLAVLVSTVRNLNTFQSFLVEMTSPSSPSSDHGQYDSSEDGEPFHFCLMDVTDLATREMGINTRGNEGGAASGTANNIGMDANTGVGLGVGSSSSSSSKGGGGVGADGGRGRKGDEYGGDQQRRRQRQRQRERQRQRLVEFGFAPGQLFHYNQQNRNDIRVVLIYIQNKGRKSEKEHEEQEEERL